MILSVSVSFFFLISIFLLSPRIQNNIYNVFLLISRNKKLSLGLLLAVLLPGTIIHELSHFIVATLTFVPTQSISIIPIVEEGRVKAGSLRHANTDPIRQTAIGLAPMIVGITLIYFVGKYVSANFNLEPNAGRITLYAATVYVLFISSISMFSSRKDIEMARFVVPIIVIIILVLYVNGITLSFSQDILQKFESFSNSLAISLGITFGIDLAVLLVLKGTIRSLEKILNIRVIKSSH